MGVGEVIRKYRKEKNMTQEQMARRLGVTPPAVNKWEKGHSMPDISLLSPIARLLNISLDTLLSHKKELTDGEAGQLVKEAEERLKKEKLEEVFPWIEQHITEYPNSFSLMLWMAQVMDSRLSMSEIMNEEKYEAYILDCYKRVLKSDDKKLISSAAESLYYFYYNKGEYEKAEEYIDFFSDENPERKRKQAMIYSKTGREADAFQMYEEILFSGYQSLNMTFGAIYILLLNEKDFDKARRIVNKITELARLFEFGEYHEVSAGLELAMIEKNIPETLYIMERMLKNHESIYGFSRSSLYAHMEFKPLREELETEMKQNLLNGFRDEETFAYLKGSSKWKEIVKL